MTRAELIEALACMERYGSFHGDIDVRALGTAALSRNYDLERENAALREAARALVAKLTMIEAHPSYRGMWGFLMAHNYTYTGPNWGVECEALQAALGPEQNARGGSDPKAIILDRPPDMDNMIP